MEDKVLETIQRYKLIDSNDNILVGVSGGPDSLCLLDLLYELNNEKRLNIKINVAHINHGIREDSGLDESFVKKFCNDRKIPFFVKQVNIKEIARKLKIGLEEAGRKVRYNFFEELVEKENINKVAIAHNQNDSAETVLMHLLRGTGTTGLKGIEPIRGIYIKPLIDCSRRQIEQYCKNRGLQPRIDSTNSDNTYTRNRIRNELIPYLEKEFNPNIISTLTRLSKIVQQENEYWDYIIEEIYSELLLNQQKNKIELDLKSFNQQNCVIKNKIVLYTINILFGNTCGIEKKNIEDILKLCERNIGNKYLIPKKEIKISICNKKIIFEVNQ